MFLSKYAASFCSVDLDLFTKKLEEQGGFKIRFKYSSGTQGYNLSNQNANFLHVV